MAWWNPVKFIQKKASDVYKVVKDYFIPPVPEPEPPIEAPDVFVLEDHLGLPVPEAYKFRYPDLAHVPADIPARVRDWNAEAISLTEMLEVAIVAAKELKARHAINDVTHPLTGEELKARTARRYRKTMWYQYMHTLIPPGPVDRDNMARLIDELAAEGFALLIQYDMLDSVQTTITSLQAKIDSYLVKMTNDPAQRHKLRDKIRKLRAQIATIEESGYDNPTTLTKKAYTLNPRSFISLNLAVILAEATTESDADITADLADYLSPALFTLVRLPNSGGAYTGAVIKSKSELFRVSGEYSTITPEIEAIYNSLQIYDSTYKGGLPCLVSAISNRLANQGIAFPSTNHISRVCATASSNGFVPTRELTAVAEQLGITIKYRYGVDELETRGRSGPIVEIFHLDNHYAPYFQLQIPAKAFGIPNGRNIRSTKHLLKRLKDSLHMRPPTPKEFLIRLPTAKLPEVKAFTDEMVESNYYARAIEQIPWKLPSTELKGKELEVFTEVYRAQRNELLRERIYEFKADNKSLYRRTGPTHKCIAMDESALRNNIAALKLSPKISHWYETAEPWTFVFDIETYKAISDHDRAEVYSISVLYPPKKEGNPQTCITYFTTPNQPAVNQAMDAITYFSKNLCITAHREIAKVIKAAKAYKLPIPRLYNKGRPMILAHNMKFDVAAVLTSPNCKSVTGIIGNKEMIVTWRSAMHDERTFVFRDTYCLIASDLGSFGKMFGLNVHKAPFPYDYFNEERTTALIKACWGPKVALVKLETFAIGCDVSVLREACNNQPFYNAESDMVNIRGYVAFYNELDVKVTYLGVKAFRDIFMREFGVDVSHCMTVGSVTVELQKKLETTDAILPIHGVLSELIRTNTRGGMVHMRNNEPVVLTDPGTMIVDMDVNSLYPASHEWLPAGAPDFVPPSEYETPALLEQKILDRPIIATIVIHNLPINRPISYVPALNEATHSNRFLQTLEPGKTVDMVIGNDFFRVLHRYQGLVYGRDYTITSMIQFPCWDRSLYTLTLYLYRMRQIAASSGNSALSTCLKLVLNNIWGKYSQRTYNDESAYFKSFHDCIDKAVNLADRLVSVEEHKLGRSRMSVVNFLKTSTPVYKSKSHCAMAVLDRSKLTMAEYHDCAEKANMPVEYGDTDSAHCSNATDENLAAFVYMCEQYLGKHPFTKDADGFDVLGKLKIDYKLEAGTFPEGVSLDPNARVYADSMIVPGPKVYAAQVVFTGNDGIKYRQPHMRAKGIRRSALLLEVDAQVGETYSDRSEVLYLRIVNDEQIKIKVDLGFKHTAAGTHYRSSTYTLRTTSKPKPKAPPIGETLIELIDPLPEVNNSDIEFIDSPERPVLLRERPTYNGPLDHFELPEVNLPRPEFIAVSPDEPIVTHPRDYDIAREAMAHIGVGYSREAVVAWLEEVAIKRVAFKKSVQPRVYTNTGQYTAKSPAAPAVNDWSNFMAPSINEARFSTGEEEEEPQPYEIEEDPFA